MYTCIVLCLSLQCFLSLHSCPFSSPICILWIYTYSLYALYSLYRFILYVCMHAKSLQSCPILCDAMDCSHPGSSLHGDSPGKDTELGCHAFLQRIMLTQGSNSHPFYLLHWQAGSLPLAPPGKAILYTRLVKSRSILLAFVGFALSCFPGLIFWVINTMLFEHSSALLQQDIKCYRASLLAQTVLKNPPVIQETQFCIFIPTFLMFLLWHFYPLLLEWNA